MPFVILACIILLMLAVGYEIYAAGYSVGGLIELVGAQPLPQKLASAVIVLAPLGLLAAALWESARLDQQRKANQVWETRFRGVRKSTEELDEAQKDIDRATNYLERSDPEDAMSALQRRMLEAERTTHLQQTRTEKEGLLARIDMVRQQQLALRERLGETIEKRRLIEPLFIELQNSQDVLEKGLAGLKADDLNDRLQAMLQSTERMKLRCARLASPSCSRRSTSGYRCGEIEQLLTGFVRLQDELEGLKARLLPLDDEQAGVKTVLDELHDMRDLLGATIERLEHDGEASLAQRASMFAETKQALDQRVSNLVDQFSKLDGINKDIRGLFAKLRGEVDAQLLAYDLHPNERPP
jgi:chromosome segregation ATPase